mmetsp:Transcript_13079/g.33100  ORF Transcript_13079/g.33100 Transcript_13079/m.33100 type:complete len:212 (+) Transcript_13079:783-1418(+)
MHVRSGAQRPRQRRRAEGEHGQGAAGLLQHDQVVPGQPARVPQVRRAGDEPQPDPACGRHPQARPARVRRGGRGAARLAHELHAGGVPGAGLPAGGGPRVGAGGGGGGVEHAGGGGAAEGGRGGPRGLGGLAAGAPAVRHHWRGQHDVPIQGAAQRQAAGERAADARGDGGRLPAAAAPAGAHHHAAAVVPPARRARCLHLVSPRRPRPAS